jgi:hypothetical protein
MEENATSTDNYLALLQAQEEIGSHWLEITGKTWEGDMDLDMDVDQIILNNNLIMNYNQKSYRQPIKALPQNTFNDVLSIMANNVGMPVPKTCDEIHAMAQYTIDLHQAKYGQKL